MINRLTLLANNFGIAYLFAWTHRVTGLGLMFFLVAHIYTLSFLTEPARFDAKMAWFNQMGLNFLEWMLALPVIFHALNGGRLMLYELYGARRDRLFLVWVAALSVFYVFALALVMALADVAAPARILIGALLVSLVLAICLVFVVKRSKIGLFWKLQRISGAVLIIMIPTHMVLMHLNPAAGHDAATILARIQGDVLLKVTDSLIVVCALFHGAYGLLSIAKDYLGSQRSVKIVSLLITVCATLLGWLGIQTIFLI